LRGDGDGRQELLVIDDIIRAHYDQGRERERLFHDGGSLELVRTQELLLRFLPGPPADILDVGGGPGAYASWLAQAGYRVHLIDPIPLHVEQALEAAAELPNHSFTAAIGDARALEAPDTTFDAVLLFGPLYHLTERSDRITALREAQRVLRPGGLVLAVGISRFGSLLDALRQGVLNDPDARSVIERTLLDGQHRNPGMERYPGWFTTAYFHLPDEMADEVAESGLELVALLGIEGPGGFVGDGWKDPEQRPHILRAACAVEAEPSLLGLSPHMLAVARKGR
jgi:ubiquinone/menaquinone biosynthesis C-methylase UbiE